MWGGSAQINSWVEGWVAQELKARHGVTLTMVPMDAAVFVNKLLDQKTAGTETGTMDLLWINGENFRNAKEQGLLWGPYFELLPNAALVDPAVAATDFGFPTEGFESPYGRAQFVFEYDSAKVTNPPRSFAELKEWVKANPGVFTYPQPPDFTGSAFVRQVFYAVSGGPQKFLQGWDQALFDAAAPALWDYLKEIEPYLWQQGRTYPRDIAALDTLFERGEVLLNMSYHQAHAQGKVVSGQYPETVRTLVMEEGSIANTHFVAIPYNAPNKAGAMVVANFLLSPDAQLSKNTPANWGDFTVLDTARLTPEDRARFETLDLGASTLPLEELAARAVPEVVSDYVEALETGWEENVLR